MEYKSAKSPVIIITMALLILMLTAGTVAVFALFKSFMYIIAVIDLMLVALIVWTLADTRYLLSDKGLVMRSGPFHDILPYEKIKTAVRTRGFNFIMALDINRIELNRDIDPSKGKIVISPVNEDEFLDELAKRCPGIDIS